ncbi:MAG TPA: hypothetical protein VER32_15030 [Pyrinomonadaceae bacterium]|nr:hypothetical protein [Pyrinomonadaceae bacterium]
MTLAKYIRPVCLSAVTLALCLNHPTLAQTADPAARKIDEFGDALPTDAAARLDNLAVALQGEPNARGFLIAYRSHRDLPGLSGRRVNWMRNYLIHNRGVDAGRVVAVDGGGASCLWHEFWIVPPGAAPKPRGDAYPRESGDADLAQKYDAYYFSIPEDDLVSFSAEYENGLEGFAGELRRRPRALAYVIVYEERRVETWEEEGEGGRKRTRRRVIVDPRGTARRELGDIRAGLVKNYGIAARRVKLVSGGYRKWREVELWVVPGGARPPVPTPNVYPPRSGNR